MEITTLGRWLRRGLWVVALATCGVAAAQSKNIAPGFPGLSKADAVVVMPVDVELFSLSAGGLTEPKADWTAAAKGHMKSAVGARTTAIGLKTQEGSEALADDFAEQVSLHAAVAQAIAWHHSTGGAWALPTKAEALNWTFGDAMTGLGNKTGARYGLFLWVRDSYASAERKAAMVLLAIAGIGITGGIQVGYASLVDLQTGQVVWFNRLIRGTGDLREADSARESIDALLSGFPAVR